MPGGTAAPATGKYFTMKLNVGDLVELLYDGTTFSGVITAVTPERVELAFTLNIFVEGPGKITWPNGVDSNVDVGANALTKLHLRLPLEEVARAYAAGEPVAVPRDPTPRPPVQPVAAPIPDDLALEDLIPDDVAAIPQPGLAQEDLEALLAELGDSDQNLLADDAPLPAGGPDFADAPREPRKREGVWVEYEALVDGVNLATNELFPASLLLVSSTGCLVRTMGAVGIGERIQLRFTLGRDAFDLASTVVHEEAPGVYEVAYDTLPSEVRVRMLRAVLGLAKPELRTQESWTYKLRQKGSG